MNEGILNYIKNEKRLNLGKRFKKWVSKQWGFKIPFEITWEVSEERAIREITESILLNPENDYFLYKDNKLISSSEWGAEYIQINIVLFKEILREYRLNYILTSK